MQEQSLRALKTAEIAFLSLTSWGRGRGGALALQAQGLQIMAAIISIYGFRAVLQLQPLLPFLCVSPVCLVIQIAAS